jgi:hypothetical protein
MPALAISMTTSAGPGVRRSIVVSESGSPEEGAARAATVLVMKASFVGARAGLEHVSFVARKLDQSCYLMRFDVPREEV